MKSLLAALLLLVLGGLGVVLWLDSEAAPPKPVEAHQDLAPDQKARQDATAETAMDSQKGADRHAVAEVPIAASAPAFDESQVAVAAWPAKGWLVQVVDEVSGEPVAGALLYSALVVDLGWTDTRSALDALLRQGHAELEAACARTQPVRTDDSGYARLPEAAQELIVWARKGDKRGIALVPDSWQRPETLTLRAPRDQVVQVVDASGTGIAQAQVSLAHAWLNPTQPFETDADGQLVLRDVNLALLSTLAFAGREGVDLEANRIQLELVPAGASPVRAWSNLLDPVPIRLVATERAFVEVQLVGPDGGTWREHRWIDLQIGADKLRREADGAGRLRVDGVPIGSAVQATWRQGYGIFTQASVEAQGVVAAQGLKLVLHGQAAPAEVSMRLVLADGAPFAAADVRVKIGIKSKGDSASNTSTTSPARTDENGVVRFGFDLAGSALPANQRLDFVVSANVDDMPLATTPLVLLGPAGFPHDFGDVLISARSLLVGGRVVSESGQPLANAFVSLVARINATTLWPVEGFGTISGPDGRFALFGALPDKQVFLRAEVPHYGRSDLVEIRAGQPDMELVVRRSGGILTSLAGAIPEGLCVRINPVDPELSTDFDPSSDQRRTRDKYGNNSPFDANGEQRWTGLWPGRYRVALAIEHQADVLMEWPDVIVESGLMTRDPGMQNIDLDALRQHVDLIVENEAGERIKNATVIVSDSIFSDPIPIGADGIDFMEWPKAVTIGADGYLSQRVLLDQNLVHVTLQAAAHVSLRVPEGLELPPGGVLRLALICDALKTGMFGPATNDVPVVDGLATLRIDGFGPQTIMLFAERNDASGNMTTNVMPLPSQQLDLASDCNGQIFDVAITQEVINKAFGL